MSSVANRVIVNTGVLYGKMILTIGISLYTTRVVLNALGATDYGIHNLVAGIVVMLSFLNAAMSTSTQRFLSYHQGSNDKGAQKKVFRNSLFLHICLAFFVGIIIEVAGLFLFDGFLNIPLNRLNVAKIIYHFMVLSVMFSVISVPFVASINAHENMIWIAIVNIVEVLLKLGVALCLLFKLITFDNLIFYGMSTTIIGVICLMLYAIYCLKHYNECSLKMSGFINKHLLTQLTTFAGWNLFGAMCGVGRTQGLAIILNLFFGTVVNAAYGVANQVSGQMNFFSATMLKALNPQIMKSEGAGDRKRMLKLSMMASKFGFLLLAIIAIPCIFEMDYILNLWLKEVPEHAIWFTRLILIAIMANQLTIGLQSAIQATGRIKVYQAVVGSVLLFNLPLAYLLLKLGFPIYSCLISFIVIELIACLLRLAMLKIYAGLSIKEYIYAVFIRIFIPVVICTLVCWGIILQFECSFYRLLITLSIGGLVFLATVYIAALEKEEKDYIKNIYAKIRLKK